MEVRGEHPCPRCGNGVLVKRHGRNGDFWGCSNYPRCRMSCDDKEGKPDVSSHGKPLGGGLSHEAAMMRQEPCGAGMADTGYAAGGFREAPPAELFDVLGSPYPTEEEMAEYQANYGPSAESFRNGWKGEDKPKYSASPMEHWQDTGGKTENKYVCPSCKDGHLRRIQGRNGAFWGCTNYPRCTATFDDGKGGPVLQ